MCQEHFFSPVLADGNFVGDVSVTCAVDIFLSVKRSLEFNRLRKQVPAFCCFSGSGTKVMRRHNYW